MAQFPTIALWGIRLGMGTLTRVLPPLGNRLAWSLYCRSPRPIASNEEDEHFLSSHGGSDGEVASIQVGKHKVPYFVIKPPGQTRLRILMLHGWGGRATTLLSLTKLCVREGAEVVLFDGPGSGLTGSKNTTLLHMLECIQQLHEIRGPFDIAIGHSFGGLAAAHALESGALSGCRCLVTIGSPNSFVEMTDRMLKQLWLPVRTLDYFNERVEELAGRPLASFGVAEALAGFPSDRLNYLCLHDTEDKEVPYSDNEEIGRALPWVEMLPSTGLGHNRILRDPETQKRIIEYLERVFYPSH